MAGTPSPRGSDTGKSPILKLKDSGLQWGWEIKRLYRDNQGVFCIRFKTGQGEMYAMTKQYAYLGEYASFPTRIVYRARDYGHPVSIFFGGDPRMGDAYIFNPDDVIEHGEVNFSDQPLPDREKWLDIEISKGVLVGDYISGVEYLG